MKMCHGAIVDRHKNSGDAKYEKKIHLDIGDRCGVDRYPHRPALFA
jgi:hypothetical protein